MSRSGAHVEAATERGRWSSRRKTEVVLRLLRGEALDPLSRALGVTVATLAQWRDQVLAAGQAGVRRRPPARQDRRADDGERAAAAARRSGGGRPPVRVAAGEAVSQTVSPSTGRR